MNKLTIELSYVFSTQADFYTAKTEIKLKSSVNSFTFRIKFIKLVYITPQIKPPHSYTSRQSSTIAKSVDAGMLFRIDEGAAHQKRLI